MAIPAWQRQACYAQRDCGCCGASGSLICLERPDHEGIHAFHCRACGRDRDC